jgi:Asp-tRNA(Asn)/Glu-tRNA(Gln) amidotransferase A subunit family amidase
MTLCQLSATEAARQIRDGLISSEELTQDCLNRIEAVDGDIQAWTHLDPDYALEQARARDEQRLTGQPLGPLHGVPVGIKDIFDTSDMPTENGTPLHAGRQPDDDAMIIAMLRQAGAVIMGKTVSTELAYFAPGKTRNPHDPERTPGGSSSGSAAAVAAHMVPVALGSQTNGSVIRPASYCGTYGYKPTHGLISRTGVLKLSRALDTMGIFARSIEDLALSAEIIMAFDAKDPDMRPRAVPPLLKTALSEPPVEPDLAFIKTAAWKDINEDSSEAFVELAGALSERCYEDTLPEEYDQAWHYQQTLMSVDMAHNLRGLYATGKDKLSPTMVEMIETGQQASAVDYCMAMEMREHLNTEISGLFDRYDAIITPATSGEAPLGLDATGSPAFCTLWTYLGVPSITIPLLSGANDMPIGVQLIGPRGDDARLMRTARWLVDYLSE